MARMLPGSVKWSRTSIGRQMYMIDQKKILEGLAEIRVGYKETIRLEVEKALGEKVKLIEDLYQEVVLALKILREKELVTREEMQEKLKVLKEKKDG